MNKTRNTITDANTMTRVLSDAVEFVGGGEGEGGRMLVLSSLLAKLVVGERNSVTVSMSRVSESGVEGRGGGRGGRYSCGCYCNCQSYT